MVKSTFVSVSCIVLLSLSAARGVEVDPASGAPAGSPEAVSAPQGGGALGAVPKAASKVKDRRNDWFDPSGNPIAGSPTSDIVKGIIKINKKGKYIFRMKVADVIPYPVPPANCAYWFALDTDRNPATGWEHPLVNDMGADLAVGAYYISGVWTIVVRDPVTGTNLTDITKFSFNGKWMKLKIPQSYIGSPNSFDWVAYTWDWTTGVLVWDNAPNGTHATFQK